MTDLVEDVALFGQRLRAQGLRVDVAQLTLFARAIAATSPQDAYWAGRAVLTTSTSGVAAYDRAFAAHYGPDPQQAAVSPPKVEVPDVSVETPDGSSSRSAHREVTLASREESLRHKRFDLCTSEDLEHLARMMQALAWRTPTRATRRRQAHRHGEIDIASTMRQIMRIDDSGLVRRHRRRRVSRRLAFVLDISGSMSAHSRALLLFVYSGLVADANWEAFCFATRLTRITTNLRSTSPDSALRSAADTVVDWDGGTRIGEAIEALNAGWAQTRVLRGAVVVICSDGLDTGEPQLLAAAMARLHRLAREVVWLNPLKSTAGFEPVARGMAAAMPYIDLFADGSDLASLETLRERLGRGRK